MLHRPSPETDETRTLDPLVIVSRGMSERAGGLEIFNANLVRALKARIEVFMAPQVATSRLADYASRTVRTMAFLRGRAGANVLVQYGSFLDVLLLPVLRLASNRIHVIAHVSDTWVHVRNPALFALTRFILRSCVRRLFVLADQQADVFSALKPIKIHTIVGSAFAEPSRPRTKRHGFAFIGRIVREKGIFDLLEAWSDPRIMERRLQLRVYGRADPTILARLDAEVTRRRLTDLVTFVGPLNGDAAVIGAMEGTEALLYPTYADAFPLVMIESFARGTPCLVSTVGEGKDFVRNPELVVDPGDISAIAEAVIRIADGRIAVGYMQTMQERARRYASAEIVVDLDRHGVISLGEDT
jgi:glycosyltransferase involved in cell wall biosynthesis